MNIQYYYNIKTRVIFCDNRINLHRNQICLSNNEVNIIIDSIRFGCHDMFSTVWSRWHSERAFYYASSKWHAAYASIEQIFFFKKTQFKSCFIASMSRLRLHKRQNQKETFTGAVTSSLMTALIQSSLSNIQVGTVLLVINLARFSQELTQCTYSEVIWK